MIVKRYRKLPVVIDAIQFTWPMLPSGKGGNFHDVEQFLGEDFLNVIGYDDGPHILIRTLEGDMHANPGDYVIRGVKGEHYPCKPDIFEATYEEVAA